MTIEAWAHEHLRVEQGRVILSRRGGVEISCTVARFCELWGRLPLTYSAWRGSVLYSHGGWAPMVEEWHRKGAL